MRLISTNLLLLSKHYLLPFIPRSLSVNAKAWRTTGESIRSYLQMNANDTLLLKNTADLTESERKTMLLGADLMAETSAISFYYIWSKPALSLWHQSASIFLHSVPKKLNPTATDEPQSVGAGAVLRHFAWFGLIFCHFILSLQQKFILSFELLTLLRLSDHFMDFVDVI